MMAAVQVTTMLGETQTWDEGLHLAAGYSYWITGDYSINPEHPALGKLLATLPLVAMRAKFEPAWLKESPQRMGLYFLYANRLPADLMLAVARSTMVAVTILFGVWIALWTKRHFGPMPSLIALTLFCFDPNMIAHGRYVTTDVIAAFFIFLATTLWIDYLLSPSALRLIFAGLALGCAVSSKYSALFLIPVLLLSGLFKRRWLGAFIVVAIAALVVFAVYAPEVFRFGQPERLLPHLSRKGAVAEVIGGVAERLNLPMWNYLVGVDRLSEHNLAGHQSYLLGQLSTSGWWYYFPVAFLVKTPMAVIAAFAITGALIWRVRENRFALWFMAAVGVIFAAFCLTSRINIGHRHLLPIYAFGYVLAGVVLARKPPLAIALAGLLVVESIAIYPHYLAFFNWAAGGPDNGSKYLLDSNLDWGQDLKKLRRYKDENHIEKPCLAYFGNGDLWGKLGNHQDVGGKLENLDCILAISATPLHGLYMNPGWTKPLEGLKPIAKVGYSIFIYDLRKAK